MRLRCERFSHPMGGFDDSTLRRCLFSRGGRPRRSIQRKLRVEHCSNKVSDIDGCFLVINLRRGCAGAGSPAVAGDLIGETSKLVARGHGRRNPAAMPPRGNGRGSRKRGSRRRRRADGGRQRATPGHGPASAAGRRCGWLIDCRLTHLVPLSKSASAPLWLRGAMAASGGLGSDHSSPAWGSRPFASRRHGPSRPCRQPRDRDSGPSSVRRETPAPGEL